MLRMILFDVEHGFCAFIKTPTGRTILIDCGKAANFSPVEYIRQNELAATVPFNGFHLTKLIVTHPHEDHIEDMARLKQDLPPAILQRWSYNWDYVKGPNPAPGSYKCLDAYSSWEATFGRGGAIEPDYGIKLDVFGLSPNEAQAISASSNSTVNNSSLVIVVSFQGVQWTPKFVFAGDMEQAGWEQLLRKPDFRAAVAGTWFYFAAHHGHTSGFSTELFDAMGKPLLNLVSVTSCDESHDDRYSKDDFSLGYPVGLETRKMVTTRTDGAIFIDVDPAGLPIVQTRHLPENVMRARLGLAAIAGGGFPRPPR